MRRSTSKPFVQSTRKGSALLRPAGTIDRTNAGAFRDALLGGVTKAHDALVVDLANVDHITSEGFAILMSAHRTARAGSKKLVLAAPRPSVQEVLNISQFHKVVPVYAAVKDALEALSSDRPAAVAG